MPAEMMIINPRAKRRRAMTALQRKYFGKGRRRSSGRVRVTRAHRNPTAVATRSASPVRRRRSRYVRRALGFERAARRAPAAVGNFVTKDLMPAAIGAGGALALDMIWPHLTFLPAALQTGPLTPVVRIAGAVGIGIVAGMIGGRSVGKAAMVGALTVTTYDVIKGYLADNVPAPAPASTGTHGYAPQLGWPNPARNAGPMNGYAPLNGYAPAYAY